VGHSSHADQAEQTRSTQAKPHVQKTNDNNRTANVQDTVTVKNTSDLVFPGRSARSEGAGLSDPAPSVAHYANAVILDGEEPNCGMWCEGIIRRTVVLSARVALNLECQSKPAE